MVTNNFLLMLRLGLPMSLVEIMRNNISVMNITNILALAIKAKDGATAHPEIALTQNTAAKIQTDLMAAQAKEAEYQGAITAIVPLQEAYLTAIDGAYTFAQRAKDVLKVRCGSQHGALWNTTGFTSALKVPATWDGLRVLLGSLGTYFSANAAHEVAAMTVTAASAAALTAALDATRGAVVGARQAAATNYTARETAFATLRVRLRGLADELKQLIGRVDVRWRVFGLKVPAEAAVPRQPEHLVVINDTPLQLLLRCDAVAYADHYRWWRRSHNAPGEPEAMGSSELPMFLLENLSGGTHWDIFVSAVNSSGTEGRLSGAAQGNVLAAAA